MNNNLKQNLKSLKKGDTFVIAGLVWKIIDVTEKGYMCLAEKLENRMMFDRNSNDWKTTSLRKYLNEELFKKIADEIGEENIIPFERNLLSLDGQTEYGTCEDKVSLLTLDEYRQNRELIPNTDDYWWWLLTPNSTQCNGDSIWLTVVSPGGGIGHDICNYDDGVRPVCIFSSLIFESEG